MFFLRGLLFFLILIVSMMLSACEEKEPEPVLTFSSLSEEERSSFRDVMRHYSSGNLDGLNTTALMPLIYSEGMRRFPQANQVDDFIIHDASFMLADTLAEVDAWGHERTGGYVEYSEGAEILRKRASYFTTGEVGNFSFVDTVEANGQLAARAESVNSFTLESDATFQSDLWYQQVGTRRTSEEYSPYEYTYAYTVHPEFEQTIDKGARFVASEVVVETIASGEGWGISRDTELTYELKGTVTRYRPRETNAPENTEMESEFETNEELRGDGRVVTTSLTSVDSTVGEAGMWGELFRIGTVKNTTWEENTYNAEIDRCEVTCVETEGENIEGGCSSCEFDGYEWGCRSACVSQIYGTCQEACIESEGASTPYRCSSCDLSEERVLDGFCSAACEGPDRWEEAGDLLSGRYEDHRTTKVNYELRPGYGEAAIETRGMELVSDYIETTREMRTVTVDGDTETTETVVYRYTDNRATRNDLANWRSTRRVVTRRYRLEINNPWSSWPNFSFEWDEEDSGAEWLTSEIEIDQEFNRVPYDYSSTTRVSSIDDTLFFGDDKNGSETTRLVTSSRDQQATWNRTTASVSGEHTVTSASISNGDGEGHSIESNADGSYEVSVGNVKATAGAEEWLDSIAP